MAQHTRKNAALQIATANRLEDGAVVYLDKNANWVENLNQANVAKPQEAQQLLNQANSNSKNVIEPYLFEITRKNDIISPISQRENIRAFGPTVDPIRA